MNPVFSRRVPEGDNIERAVCERCGFVDYDNPKIVVGAVVTCGPRVLLCRRAIAPRKGLWTLPAGYMEHGETPEEGARRETYEEATADIVIEGLLAVYTIRRLGQVQLIYRARMEAGAFAPGPESEAVGLFAEDEIPWDAIAFPTVHWALAHARQPGGPFVNPPGGDESGPDAPPYTVTGA
ncbi:NUDIX hydrolase [Acuticoccus mangrovi]|uniref:NUDIX hydrolase n=1 Tax=Acuticoccus mangrovi TaxID=2796142 RepID=A0A934IV65_9HYPH|nr:NUDIX hydrolase [Acuticoccus mangrovi]